MDPCSEFVIKLLFKYINLKLQDQEFKIPYKVYSGTQFQYLHDILYNNQIYYFKHRIARVLYKIYQKISQNNKNILHNILQLITGTQHKFVIEYSKSVNNDMFIWFIQYNSTVLMNYLDLPNQIQLWKYCAVLRELLVNLHYKELNQILTCKLFEQEKYQEIIQYSDNKYLKLMIDPSVCSFKFSSFKLNLQLMRYLKLNKYRRRYLKHVFANLYTKKIECYRCLKTLLICLRFYTKSLRFLIMKYIIDTELEKIKVHEMIPAIMLISCIYKAAQALQNFEHLYFIKPSNTKR